MADVKTKPTDVKVEDYINAIDDEKVRDAAHTVLAMLRDVTGMEPKMWGPSMIGFGRYRYTYASGHSGEAFLTGFSPRKANMTLYIMPGFEAYDDLLQAVGKHKTGVSCLYLNKKLDGVDLAALRRLVEQSFDHIRRTIPDHSPS
jgi:hypothetical protein